MSALVISRKASFSSITWKRFSFISAPPTQTPTQMPASMILLVRYIWQLCCSCFLFKIIYNAVLFISGSLMSQSIIDFDHFYEWLKKSDLYFWHESLPEIIGKKLSDRRWGDMPAWENAICKLPSIKTNNYDLKSGVTIGTVDEITLDQQED
jgi:hypothetical protein